MKRKIVTAAAVGMGALAIAPVAALALGAGSLVNDVVDTAQPTIVDWISTVVTSGVALFLTWLSRAVGIKALEYFNRDAVAAACRNYANFVIDELQIRFAGAGGPKPDLADLVHRGVGYVSAGSKDAIREQDLTRERLAKQVEGALREKGAELAAVAVAARAAARVASLNIEDPRRYK